MPTTASWLARQYCDKVGPPDSPHTDPEVPQRNPPDGFCVLIGHAQMDVVQEKTSHVSSLK